MMPAEGNWDGQQVKVCAVECEALMYSIGENNGKLWAMFVGHLDTDSGVSGHLSTNSLSRFSYARTAIGVE